MDVTILYTNIPQDEGITMVCEAYDKYHNNSPPIPSHYLKQILALIFKENSFQFNGENYCQIHRTAMGTKMAVSFTNLFMAEIETKMLGESRIKPKVWKRYIDDVFSLRDVHRKDIDLFIEQANTFHPNVYSWNLRERNHNLRHDSVQRWKIPKRSYPRRQNSLQADRDFVNIHTIPLATYQALREALLRRSNQTS